MFKIKSLEQERGSEAVADESAGRGTANIVDRTFGYSIRVARLCSYREKRNVPRALVSQLLRSGWCEYD